VIVSPAKDLNYKKELMEFLSMSNRELVFVDQGQELPLQNLHWQNSGIRNLPDGSQSVSFDAIIKIKDSDDSVVKITKTYTIRPADYMLDCNITVENLSDSQQKIRFNLAGPLGLSREGFRTDMRKVIAGFRETTTQEITRIKVEKKNLLNGQNNLAKAGAAFLWASSVNKYFAFIAVPLPDEGKEYCDWLIKKDGHLYNPDGDTKANTGDEMFGVDFGTAPVALASAGQLGNQKTYKFQLYIGPKDKSLFDKNEEYRNLGFVQTIDFLGCCCPAGIIYPLAFGILALMKMMYTVIPNYGFVIIILVFLMRLIIHPLTKKSQVSMSKMGKLAPQVEEIKKKYANNKAEMNKQMMAVYREQGASPIMGMLPMMVQMPIWIALWSAVYTSIDLRGASFLPFWITDLSVPDAAYTFSKALVIPLLGWKIESINLLPILMGVAFYLQQKLMPSQGNASTNPQMAQQQKMMKIMMPLMFPIFLYKGPSGVNLYIMSSTFAGVIEQYVIRKHIREKDEAESQGLVAVTKKTGGKVKKKKPKPFFKT
jgi:YidC/Oxa1 family membrane protein insertase